MHWLPTMCSLLVYPLLAVAVASLLTLRYLAAKRSVLCWKSCASELRGYEPLLPDTSAANAHPS